MSNVWKIRDALVPALREDRDVVVDLSEVEFFDGRLVRLLVQARVAAFRRGQAFRIVPPRERHALWRVAEAGELRLAA